MWGSGTAYAWLPEGARRWREPHGGAPGTFTRFVIAISVLVPLRMLTDIPVPWLVAAAVAAAVLSAVAYPLRRRSARPRGGAWLLCEKESVAWMCPAPGGPPAIRTTVATADGRLLGPAASAGAVRAAAALLRATDRDPEALTAVGAGVGKPDKDGDEEPGPQYVVHDGRSAFMLRLDGDGDGDGDNRDDRDGRGREGRGERGRARKADGGAAGGAEAPDEDSEGSGRRALLARTARLLGTAVPAQSAPPRPLPDEAAVTADDVRAYARAGHASAQRLEQEFATLAVRGPSDVALALGRLRGWTSRYDGLGVRELTALEPEVVAEGLREDLAARAAVDRSRTAGGDGVTRVWQEGWQPDLDRVAVRVRPAAADTPDVAFTDGVAPPLSPVGRAAELLAASAAAARGAPLHGTDPDTRPLPWPPHRARLAAADRALRLLTLAAAFAPAAPEIADRL